MNSYRSGLSALLLLLCLLASLVSGFSLSRISSRASSSSSLGLKKNEDDGLLDRRSLLSFVAGAAVAISPSLARADEYGRETEMAFLSTGETVMICTKRGVLGKCLETERRTAQNENDKSEKYFRQPTVLGKDEDPEVESNELIARLKKRSEENAEKNEMLVYQRTQMNDSSASFGPFDGNVLILNEDGKGFTLLENPQAMRLKKAGFIENKKFVKQPTQEEIDAALEKEPNIIDKFFGAGN